MDMQNVDSGIPQTKGEKAVRLSFNPGQNKNVELVKERSAELIDFVESMKFLDPRLAALAQTAYEEAAMWAVKLATTPASPDVGVGAVQDKVPA